MAALPAETHALLADVPRSAAHFPDVLHLVALGDNTFRWEMKRVGLGDIALQTVYASHYRSDAARLWVGWEPVHGVGNAEVSGHWQLVASPHGTRVHLALDTRFELPLPHLLQHVAEHLVGHELNRQVDIYIANLRRTLGAPH
ncbi:MAG: hypothetical protein Q7V62_07365 [Actinomycetota bacterium]|nr:hypothetical protein [Actinomycetota bacterium]